MRGFPRIRLVGAKAHHEVGLECMEKPSCARHAGGVEIVRSKVIWLAAQEVKRDTVVNQCEMTSSSFPGFRYYVQIKYRRFR